MTKFYNFTIAMTLSFLIQGRAHAAVEPTCGDKELANLQATVAASNLANINTTHTPEGGAYKKRVAVRHRDGHCEIQVVGAFRKIHEPGNPDADTEGFVKYPDISATTEQKNLLQAREKLKKLKHTSSNKALPSTADIDFD